MPLQCKNKTNIICKFDDKINNILNTTIPTGTDIHCSTGLETHLKNSNHKQCIKYIADLKNIILSADYIGQGGKCNSNSFELVKILDDNILVAI